MKRFYRLTDDPKKVINIDDISMIDFDASINKYMILISGLKHCIMVTNDDAFAIMDKLQIINDF